jgi:hypothetical protein
MTLASDTYFKKGVNIHVFIEHMKKIFILTDLMYSGQHLHFENFIRSANIKDIEFTYEPEYWNLHKYDWESYDELFCIIDHRDGYEDNPEFVEQLHKRIELLKQNGFGFILARPWESPENVANSKFYALLKDVVHTKWFGGTTWFWYWMRQQHTSIECDHSNKPYRYLYLNKIPRSHRVRLWNQLHEKQLLDKSLTSFIGLDPPVRLEAEYELPDVDPRNYPATGKDQDIYKKPYEHTACSLISETNDNDDVFITEKLWKPIMCGHFFIVHGNYLYLQRLKEMGFKTFGNYFDESYDLEQDPNKRIDNIVSLCSDLRTKKWQDIYLQTKALRQHNYDTMFDKEKLSLEINKTLNLFLEFADSR